MWLELQARKAVSMTLRVGCFLKIFPYNWDPKKYRLVPATRFGMFLFRLHAIVGWGYMGFLIFRFLQILAGGMKDVPSRLWIMNLMWALGYLLYNICNIQFDINRQQIMYFANQLFKETEPKIEAHNKEKRQGTDWSSCVIIFSQFMLIVNPPTHSTQLLNVPCGPQYPSSLIFNCTSTVDLVGTTLQKLPFVILEDLLETDLMFAWTFNCTLVYLVIMWARGNLRQWDYGQGPASSVFRRTQIIMLLVNDTFRLYLQTFPSILFTIAGVFIFGAIRYQDLPFHLYVVFPFCGLRCLLEGMMVLSIAGRINKESIQFQRNWFQKIQGTDRAEAAAHKSCPPIQCTAGSLFTFENSIVLVTLHNCTQLTFNMLVSFKTKSVV